MITFWLFWVFSIQIANTGIRQDTVMLVISVDMLIQLPKNVRQVQVSYFFFCRGSPTTHYLWIPVGSSLTDWQTAIDWILVNQVQWALWNETESLLISCQIINYVNQWRQTWVYPPVYHQHTPEGHPENIHSKWFMPLQSGWWTAWDVFFF